MKEDKRKNRVFKSERRDIKFPMWRKKVDRSLFQEKGFTVTKFAQEWWDLDQIFPEISNSKKDPKNQIKINFGKKIYHGFITRQDTKTRKNSYRVFYDEKLADALKETFLMTFMRDLEHRLGNYDLKPEERVSIEEVIPFTEFLDIEFDRKQKKFILTAHYTQKPTFPHLFAKILNTTLLKSIELESEDRLNNKVVVSRWLKRSQLKDLPDKPNVIYMLLDQNNKELYIGEAKSLNTRLNQERAEIPNWTHFRYNLLPPELEPFRVNIERMVIRNMASVFKTTNEKVDTIILSEYTLKNKRIDP